MIEVVEENGKEPQNDKKSGVWCLYLLIFKIPVVRPPLTVSYPRILMSYLA